jgi:DNA gyrase subunit B
MTDADVDGAHIRTLLLTFFYRQMRPLIDRGHICIAQPPLYKVAKGKDERYLSSNDELSAFIIRKATEEKTVKVNGNAFSGQELSHLLHALIEYDRLVRSVSRLGLDRDVVEAILAGGLAGRADFERPDNLDALGQRLSALGHDVEATARDEEHGLYEMSVRSATHGRREFRVSFELIQSVEFRQLRRLQPQIAPFLHAPLRVCEGEDETALGSKEELLAHLMEAGKKGLTIQRYKGLGEMNPDQLWETTMDPERRSVLQVRLEDAAEADMLFSILMGDAVEPRRQFIEDNALDVQNLDI